MFDKSKQSDDIPRVKFKQKINKKKQKDMVPLKPLLNAPQLFGNGLKKKLKRYKKHAPKRKTVISEENSTVNSHVSNQEPQHIPHNSPPEAENNNFKKKRNNNNKTTDATNSFSTEISVKSSSQSDNHQAQDNIGGDLSLKHETEISEHSTSRKRKYDDTKVKKKKSKKKKSKKKKCTSDVNEVKLQNNLDNLDEVILNVKKKKYDENFKKYDIEDILFCENIGDSKEHKESKKCNEVINEKTENEPENDLNKTKEKKKYGNKINDSDINGKAESNVHKESVMNIEDTKLKPKVKDNRKGKDKSNDSVINDKAENNVDKQSVTNIKETKSKPKVNDIQKRKDKIKKILELGNRNNIKASSNKLRERMLERLKAAKFRYLNEKLYTSTGSEAQELFQSDPEAFHTYHEGYQQQLKKWPINPLDLIIKKIEKMPSSHVIADMGCGTAALAARVPHAVHSFDLVAAAPGVRACDMARTPLPPASVDVAVYCLALMGTQLAQYLLEANRILKLGGTLLIAEVESRFADAEAFARQLGRLGFQLRQLERRRVFLLLELRKAGAPRRGPPPPLVLRPCLYKRR